MWSDGDVVLRPFEPEDAAGVARYLNHPELVGRRYLPEGMADLLPLSMGQVAEALRKWQPGDKEFCLAVVRGSSGEIVGHVSAAWSWDPHSPSVTVVIDPAHQRQGIGSAALRRVLSFVFGHIPAHCVTVWIDSWNEAGLAFAGRIGFRHAGQMRQVGLRNGQFYDTVVMDLLRPEWLAREGGGDVA